LTRKRVWRGLSPKKIEKNKTQNMGLRAHLPRKGAPIRLPHREEEMRIKKC